MSHVQFTAPWPPIPAPRTQAEADEYWADGGASPSRAEDWPRIEALVAAHPDGCPLPVGWTADDAGFRIRLDIYQSGELGLFAFHIARVGEGDEAGKTWVEHIQLTLPVEGDLAEAVASATVSTGTQGYTRAEQAEQDRRAGVLSRLRAWANSQESATIPWGDINGGGRRDIADCLDAIDAVREHPRRGEWVATVQAALEVYPVARPGLETCIRDIGQAEVFGLPPLAPLWILGADDAEMRAIESLLRECGQRVHYACDRSGQRVRPGMDGYDAIVTGDPVIAVEVAGPWGQPQIDHHGSHERASWGPDRFLAASSIGQVIERLAAMGVLPASWSTGHGALAEGLHQHPELGGLWCVGARFGYADVIPAALVFEAAADHCPAAAIAGLCPGVDPGAFAPFLAESKRQMYFPGMSAEDFARELATSRATLLAAPPCLALCPPVDQGNEPGVMRDLRHLEPGTVPAAGSGECYPAEFLVGIVAAIFEGIGFVCRIRRADGRLALRSNGHGQGTAAGTWPAEVFLADPSAFGCGPRLPPGPNASYGSPVRGYFGGTLA